jgi:hypothetical protein
MKMKDAGTDIGSPMEVTSAKKSYPRLTLDLDAFPELNEVGKKATLVIEVCVTGVRSDDYGSTVDVEVEECGVKQDDKNDADEELEKMSKSNLVY